MKTLKQIQEEKFTNILREPRFPMLTMKEHRECTKEWLQQKREQAIMDYEGDRVMPSQVIDELLEELTVASNPKK